MSGNMEDDLFYDLFGEQGFLSPESLDSNSSTDQDSGHGSPIASSFDASPQQTFGWETSDHVGELWGSILDDLPSDITDESDSNEYKTPSLSSTSNLDDQFAWSTKVVEESDRFDCNENPMDFKCGWTMEQENSMLNQNNCITDDSMFKTQNNVEDSSSNSSFSDSSPIPQFEDVLSSASPDEIMNQKEIKVQSTAPIVITPTNVNNKGATWVVKAADIKSHFQIGQNIVAIIQNINPNSFSEKTPLTIEQICNESIINHNILENDVKDDICQEDGYSLVNHGDHDYADKEIPKTKETTGVSKGLGPGLILTDEEKKLLELESLKLPEDAPLTKEEEKILKKVRRKIKNKQSAMESRRKRKEYIDNLERRVKHCTDLNHGLRKKVDKLTKENKSLVNQLKTMKEFIAASFNQTKTATKGTCLAVLVLSFALFILPFNTFQYDTKHHSLPTEGPNPTPMFRSRTLLSVEDNAEYTYHDNESNVSVNSHLTEHLFNELNTTPVNFKIHITSLGHLDSDFLLKKTNISMYIHENSTWHSMVLKEKHSNHYINS